VKQTNDKNLKFYQPQHFLPNSFQGISPRD